MTRVPKITEVGPDVDLEAEDIRLADGTRLTDDAVDDINEQVLRSAGRPSLTAPGKHSPSVTVRLPESLNHRLTREAERTGKRRSTIIRDLLDQALAQ